MTKITSLVLTLGIGVSSIVGLNGCITVIPEPVPAPTPTPAPMPEPTTSTVTVIECPEEAHIGQYITVKVRVPKWDEYYLNIYNPNSIALNSYEAGRAIPDDNLICCWYFAIPAEGVWSTYTNEEETEWDWLTRPGNYVLQIEIEISEDQSTMLLLERNIIIKD